VWRQRRLQISPTRVTLALGGEVRTAGPKFARRSPHVEMPVRARLARLLSVPSRPRQKRRVVEPHTWPEDSSPTFFHAGIIARGTEQSPEALQGIWQNRKMCVRYGAMERSHIARDVQQTDRPFEPCNVPAMRPGLRLARLEAPPNFVAPLLRYFGGPMSAERRPIAGCLHFSGAMLAGSTLHSAGGVAGERRDSRLDNGRMRAGVAQLWAQIPPHGGPAFKLRTRARYAAMNLDSQLHAVPFA
jgi:hypothetical protein